jgi:hypothetical protein
MFCTRKKYLQQAATELIQLELDLKVYQKEIITKKDRFWWNIQSLLINIAYLKTIVKEISEKKDDFPCGIFFEYIKEFEAELKAVKRMTLIWKKRDGELKELKISFLKRMHSAIQIIIYILKDISTYIFKWKKEGIKVLDDLIREIEESESELKTIYKQTVESWRD